MLTRELLLDYGRKVKNHYDLARARVSVLGLEPAQTPACVILGSVPVQTGSPLHCHTAGTHAFSFLPPSEHRDGTEAVATKAARGCQNRAEQRPEALREISSTQLRAHVLATRLRSISVCEAL